MPAAEGEEAARSAAERLAAPVRLEAPRSRAFAQLRLSAFLVALAGHAGVLYWAAREAPDPLVGGQGRLLDAVDVTIVDSSVFEARQNAAVPAPAAADAVEAKEGTVEADAALRQPERKEEKAKPEVEAPNEPDAVLTTAPPVPQPRQKQVEEQNDPTTPATAGGGAAARGDALSPAKQSAPAAASPGAVREYERYVAQALAKTKPKGGLGYGTVRVKLVISADGEIASVDVIKSSGNKRLDEAALAAVRRAKFPRPPAGMTDSQRWFEFPYYFR